MLPAQRTKEQQIFPGSRKPVLEVICPHIFNQPLGSLASLSSKLLDSSPYGGAFPTRVVAHPEFAFGISYSLKMSIAPAVREVSALCANKDAVVMFNIIEGLLLPSMQVAGAINYGYIASKGKMAKAKKMQDGSTHIDVRRRATEKNGLGLISLVCYEATLQLKNVQPGQIFIVPSYGIPATEAARNLGAGRAFIINDALCQKAFGAFREGDFWTKKTENGVTYFWLWE